MMKFLVGYNGSNVAKTALFLARSSAEALGATVFVVTSMGGGRVETIEDINKAADDLAFAEKIIKEKAIPCETHQLARGMSPGEDLVTFAKEKEVNLIFVGVEKKSKAQKMILGSTAQHVILKAHCPVISTSRANNKRGFDEH